MTVSNVGSSFIEQFFFYSQNYEPNEGFTRFTYDILFFQGLVIAPTKEGVNTMVTN